MSKREHISRELIEVITQLKVMPERPRIALALGGGVARGIAHIGVLQVLEEIGLPIDLVVGTSAGAIAGAFWASGISSDKMYRIATKTEWWFLAKPVAFGNGLLSSHGIEDWLRRLLKHDDFADLPIKFIATATDFLTGELVILDSGDLAHGVRISCTVPGIYQPVRHKGKDLVDGGLVQNLPVQVCRDFGADVVIGVDVHSDVLGCEVPQTAVVSVIHSANILQRHHELAQLQLVDFVIQPKVGELSAISFKQFDQFVEKGRVAAQDSLGELTLFLRRVVGEGI